MPMFGNKFLVVINGLMDINGKVRTPTWTTLSTTANVNSTSITLAQNTDW